MRQVEAAAVVASYDAMTASLNGAFSAPSSAWSLVSGCFIAEVPSIAGATDGTIPFRRFLVFVPFSGHRPER